MTASRANREAEVRDLCAQACARLGSLYGDPVIDKLLPTVRSCFPLLAHPMDLAEAAVDEAARAYRKGDEPDSSQFQAALARWEARWGEAIAADLQATCSDCGRTSPVLVATDYGARYCRSCLRPEPLRATLRTKGIQ